MTPYKNKPFLDLAVCFYFNYKRFRSVQYFSSVTREKIWIN